MTVRAVLVGVVLLGFGLRLVNVDLKPLWLDEAGTLMQVTGRSPREVRMAFAAGEIQTAGDLARATKLEGARGLPEVVTVLATTDPHPPLFAILLRIWMEVFGDSVVAARSLSVLFGVLLLPATFWLGLELFRDRGAALLLTAVMAASPFHVLFAQEARQYSLWALAIVASSAALLRALRIPTRGHWSAYALTVAVGVYVQVLFALVIISHALYVAARSAPALRVAPRLGVRLPLRYAGATAVGLAAFVPWAMLVMGRLAGDGTQSLWLLQPMERVRWLGSAVAGLASVFVDITGLGVRPEAPTLGDLIRYPSIAVVTGAAVIALVVSSYALLALCATGPPLVWQFALGMAVPSFTALVLPDLLFGTRIATAVRYLIPLMLGLQIAVAYVMIPAGSSVRTRVVIPRVVAAAVFVAGLASSTLIAHSAAWWNKANSMHDRDVATTINTAHRPLVLVATGFMSTTELVALSTLLAPDLAVRGLAPGEAPYFDVRFDSVFLLDGSFRTRHSRGEDATVTLEPSGVDLRLWRVLPRG